MDKKKLEDLTEQEVEQLRAQFMESMQDAKAKAEEARAKGGPEARMEAGMALIAAMTATFEKMGLMAEDDPRAGLDPTPIPETEEPKAVIDAFDQATLRDAPVELLVERYAAIASAARQAIEHGRVTRHNRLSDRVRAIGAALKARIPDGRLALLPLLSHPDPGVRDFAAYDCREFTPSETKPTSDV